MASSKQDPEKPGYDDCFVAERLRALRVAHGITQEQLASAIGISIPMMQKYEALTSGVSASRLQQIAAFFGAPVMYFFAAEGKEDAVHHAYVALLQVPGALELLKLYSGAAEPLSQLQIRSFVEMTARLEAAATNPQAAFVQEAAIRATRQQRCSSGDSLMVSSV